jgi:hypothetical protein
MLLPHGGTKDKKNKRQEEQKTRRTKDKKNKRQEEYWATAWPNNWDTFLDFGVWSLDFRLAE